MRVCDKCGEDIPKGADYHETSSIDPQEYECFCDECWEDMKAYYEGKGEYEYERWKDDKLTGDI